ncbi:MFS transporter [Ottowia caeni]|uniref:MFS transporter n=1 Tax=Ottowia caeni TaxID=2870339 RepID=UPI003D73FED9
MNRLPRHAAVAVFLAFAFAYFISTLLRAVMATLSPSLSSEFGLQARDLGLLAGGYFIGFAITQLPLGAWLDRYGPTKVVLAFLTMAVAGCAAFAMSSGFVSLLGSRVLIGMGVSACLMAPLTGYRRWFDAGTQMRATSWMLMTGSLGMLASTLPMQWLIPHVGWRVPFWGLAAMVVLSMVVIAKVAPKWMVPAPSSAKGGFPVRAPRRKGCCQVTAQYGVIRISGMSWSWASSTMVPWWPFKRCGLGHGLRK